MSHVAEAHLVSTERPQARVRDFVALAKPRITFMVILTAAGGLFLAPTAVPLRTILCTLVGIALIVAGANTFNMVIERDVDRHMTRTRNRPLPAGRLTPKQAIIFGFATSILSVPVLAFGVNALTAFLAVLANVIYVLAYTPLKQRSHLALEVGAIPGAIPPLLGWTAAMNRVDGAALVLFGILFFWQLPHFHAIALFRRDEYARAGLQVLPNVHGDDVTKHRIIRYLAVLLAVSLLLFPLGVAHRVYLFVALGLGAVFFGWGCWGLRRTSGARWARSLFGISILYLVLLFATLMIDPLA
ncbi:MAG TPA: heme o synthase [Polyangiaceae bacterium]|jgi:protoheme IX farnesyltransferase